MQQSPILRFESSVSRSPSRIFLDDVFTQSFLELKLMNDPNSQSISKIETEILSILRSIKEGKVLLHSTQKMAKNSAFNPTTGQIEVPSGPIHQNFFRQIQCGQSLGWSLC